MQYVVKKERLYSAGNERVRYRIEYPIFEEYANISAFFERVAQNCVDYCNKELYDPACEGGGKYNYGLVARVTHFDEGALSVLISVRQTGPFGEHRETARAVTWDVNTGFMMPCDVIVKRYAAKEAKRLAKKKVYLQNGRVLEVADASRQNEK